jgi:asparagine synthase (glutamine-hydrolysing)
MCGIGGIINKNNKSVEELLIHQMTDIIAHRGPDSSGSYLYKNIAFGHRRLSILDLSSSGHQPMKYLDDLVITYNGEIYNFIEIREELIQKGYIFDSNSDTEVILKAYHCWGKTCVNYFNGMWSFSILDIKQKIVFCSRDRFGVKPFYYIENNDLFSFGSEISQLLPFLPNRILNKKVALDYLISGIEECSNETFFKDIYLLKGGHNLVFDLQTNSYEIERYYNLKLSDQKNTSVDDYIQELKRSITLRLRSDVKVGTCLSGGIDSSTISSFASKLYQNSNEKFMAIHAKSSEYKTDESEFAKIVSKIANINLNFVEPSYSDFKSNILSIIKIQQEPFGSLSIIMQYFVFKKAKELGCIVMLDGQGGDETLLGYERYYPAIVKSKKGIAKLKALLQSSKNSRLSLLDTIKYQYYFSNYKLRLKRLKFKNSFYKSEILNEYESEELRIISESYNDISILQKNEIESSQLPHLLKYEDRNSMANSIESRLPFLDYKLVELSLNTNNSLKIKDGWTKFILRKAAETILPKEIVWRKAKLGFNAPEKTWTKEFENEMIKEIEQSEILNNFIHFKKLYFKNLDLRTKWRLYNFSAWEKEFKVKLN